MRHKLFVYALITALEVFAVISLVVMCHLDLL